jgi:hypothetical protein
LLRTISLVPVTFSVASPTTEAVEPVGSSSETFLALPLGAPAFRITTLELWLFVVAPELDVVAGF